MTIHKAKGLEFPVVILPFSSSRGQTDAISSSPFYWSDSLGLAFNVGARRSGEVRLSPLNYVYRSERQMRQDRDRAEVKRLLYVAATRAQSHLIVSGVDKPRDETFMALMREPLTSLADGSSGAQNAGVAVRENPAVTTDTVSALARSASTARKSIAEIARSFAGRDPIRRDAIRREFAVTEVNETVRSASAEAHEPVPGPHLDVDTILEREELEAAFGTLCHYLIERHGIAGPPLPEPGSVALPARLRPPLPADDLAIFTNRALSLAASFRDSALADRLRTASAIEYELPFLTRFESRDNHVWVRGQVDLVAIYPDHVLVVDFKTDRVLHPDDYAAQLAIYRRAVETIFSRSAVSMLYHLRTGSSFELSESFPDEEIVAAALGTVVLSPQ
jgi:ATP-dependent exoDNAse (exonuclease V) beta subunit